MTTASYDWAICAAVVWPMRVPPGESVGIVRRCDDKRRHAVRRKGEAKRAIRYSQLAKADGIAVLRIFLPNLNGAGSDAGKAEGRLGGVGGTAVDRDDVSRLRGGRNVDQSGSRGDRG